jgi:hypothetical protein
VGFSLEEIEHNSRPVLGFKGAGFNLPKALEQPKLVLKFETLN